jgi:hypothetical protein
MNQAAPLIEATEDREDEFLRLLRRQFPQPPDNSAAPASLDQLVDALGRIKGTQATSRPLVERVIQAGGGDSQPLSLCANHFALLAWVDESWRRLHIDYPLHTGLAIKIQNLLPAVAAAAVSDAQFLYAGEHPLQKLLDQIYTHCMGWHRGLGRAGRDIYTKLENIETALLTWFDDSPPDVGAILTDLQEFLEKERERADKMRQRVLQTEQGQLKTSSARTTAARMLNESMAEKQFSRAMIALLHGPWYESLQLTLLKSGIESSSWTFVKKLNEALIYTMQPFDPEDEEHLQSLYKIIPGITSQLGRALISLQSDPPALEQVLAEVEATHIKLMKGELEESVEFEPLDTGALDADSKVSEQMLEVISTLQDDDCFGIKMDAGGMQRMHLALKMDEFEQLLFVNRLGMKALTKSFEEFACLLSSGVAMPMAQGPAFSRCLQQALDNPALAADPLTAQPGASEPIAARAFPVETISADRAADEDIADEAATEEFIPDQPAVDEINSIGNDAEEYMPGEPGTDDCLNVEPGTEQLAAKRHEAVGWESAEPEAVESYAAQPYAARPEVEQTSYEAITDQPGIVKPVAFESLPAAAELEPEVKQQLVQKLQQEHLSRGWLEDQITDSDPDLELDLDMELDLGFPEIPADEAEAEPTTEPSPLESLRIGDWICFNDGEQEQSCRLVVHVDSQDLYLFVNEQGVRQREFRGEELSALFKSGDCNVLLQGSQFSDSVGAMMRRLRTDAEGEAG